PARCRRGLSLAYQTPVGPNWTLPHTVSAAICGMTPAAFRQHCIRAGVIELGDRNRPLLASIERFLGRTVTLEDWFRAQLAREPERAYQRRRQHELRQGVQQ